MSINGKRELFTKQDLAALAKVAGIKTRRAYEMLDRVITTMRTWPVVAEQAGIAAERIKQIKTAQRLSLLKM